MIEGLYLEFKKKVEKKYKVDIDSLIIEDVDGEVSIKLKPVTQSFSFDTKSTTDNSESIESEEDSEESNKEE